MRCAGATGLCQAVLTALSLAVKCSVCKNVSDTYDPFLDLSLEIGVRRQGRGRGGALLWQGMFLPYGS